MKGYLVIILALMLASCSTTSKFNKAQAIWAKGDSIMTRETIYHYMPEEKAEKLLPIFNEALEIYPRHASSFNSRGLAYYHMGKYFYALSDFDKALEINPWYSAAYNNRGMTNEEMGDYDAALRDYGLSIKVDSSNHLPFYNTGIIYADRGECEEAVKWYSGSIERYFDYTGSHNNRGNCYNKLGMHQEALEDFNAVLGMDSLHELALNGRGLAKYYLGDYEGAIEDYNRAMGSNTHIDDDKVNIYALNNIANSYFKWGKTQQACEYWQKALDNGYVYKSKWKKEYGFDDPAELVKLHCQ